MEELAIIEARLNAKLNKVKRQIRRFGRKKKGNPCKIMRRLNRFTEKMDEHGFEYTPRKNIPYYRKLKRACRKRNCL